MTATARKLGVPPQDLRQLVWSTSLASRIYEAIEQTLDEAQVLRDALKGDDKARRLQAATVLLTQSEAGRRRGWGRGRALRHQVEARPVTLQWLRRA